MSEEPSHGLFQSGPPPLPYEPSTAEKLEMLGRAVTESMDVMLAGWRVALARSPYGQVLTEQGYVGNRCGWYPERPKRRRPSTR